MNYDADNRMTKLTDWTGDLQYQYDNAGRVITLRDYNNRTLAYAYDAANRITSMVDWHGHTPSYTYTAVGQVSTVIAPGDAMN